MYNKNITANMYIGSIKKFIKLFYKFYKINKSRGLS